MIRAVLLNKNKLFGYIFFLFLATLPQSSSANDVKSPALFKLSNNIVHITIKLVCDDEENTVRKLTGRGTFVFKDSDSLFFATALHVLFPEESNISDIAGEQCGYSLILHENFAVDSGKTYATLNSDDVYKGAIFNDESLNTTFHNLHYIDSDIQKDFALLRVPHNKVSNRGFFDTLQPIKLQCSGEKQPLGSTYFVHASGENTEISASEALKLHKDRKSKIVTGSDKICSGDSGGPVFVKLGPCSNSFALAGVISSCLLYTSDAADE